MQENESKYTTDFTGEFLNEEPTVFRGLTDSEVKKSFLGALVISAPISAFLTFVIGIPFLFIVFLVGFSMIFVFYFASWMLRARRGKPPGYAEHVINKSLRSKGLLSSNRIDFSYKWSLGRTKNNPKKLH